MRKIILTIVSLSVLVFFACDSDLSTNEGDSSVNYDAKGLLSSWANNHIIADYVEFSELTENLVDAKDDLLKNKSKDNLEDLRKAYLKAYTHFQRIGMYNVGLAESMNYYSFLNVFPTNVETIEMNIDNEVNAEFLNQTAEQSTQGFPAIDYLINGIEDKDEKILDALSNDHLHYLSLIIDKIDMLTKTITADWQNGFAESFISESGSSATGSPNVFYNALIFYFENNLRRQKIDVPAGVFTSDTFSDKIESVYAPEYSKELLLEAFQQFEDFYLGSDADTESLSSALIKSEREDLDAAIKSQFAVAESAIRNLDDNLQDQIESDNIVMLEARDEIQKLIVYFKSDVTSALDFSILFADNDGD